MAHQSNLSLPLALELDHVSAADVAQTAINWLAPELLVEIFRIFCITYDATSETFRQRRNSRPKMFSEERWVYKTATLQYQRNLGILRHISRYWCSIIDSTSQLWAVLSASDPIEVTLKTLLKSGDSALAIRGIFERDEITEATEFINLITPRIHRWEWVALSIPLQPELAWLDAAAPRLRTFLLEGDRPRTITPTDANGPINLFQEVAPLLERIRIAHMPVNLGSAIFHHLKHMSLTGIRISMAELLDTFAMNPNMEGLNLSRLVFDNLSHPIVGRINLPCLSTLGVGQMNPLILQEILLHIIAPHCRNVTLSSVVDGEGSILATWLMQYLHYSVPAVLQIPFEEIRVISMHTDVFIVASDWTQEDFNRGHVNSEKEPIGQFVLTLPMNEVEMQVVPWLAGVCKSATITLNFMGMMSTAPPGVDEVYLASIPNTRVLILSGFYTSAYLLEVLSKPAAIGEKEVWLLPRLEEFALFTQLPFTRKDVLAAVRARYDNETGIEPPTPFKRLDISELPGQENREVYEELRDLVGADVLEWDDPSGPHTWAADWEAEEGEEGELDEAASAADASAQDEEADL